MCYYRGGYKMKIQAYMGGNGTGEGTHISLYHVLCKGDNDDSLHWPFLQHVKFTLQPQSNNVKPLIKTITDSEEVRSQPTNIECFGKPPPEGNTGRGFTECFSHNTVSTGYIKDNAIEIYITVDEGTQVIASYTFIC